MNEKINKDYADKQESLGDASSIQQVGHSSEAIWVRVLKRWLPPQYALERRKYILYEDEDGQGQSGETDIIVFNPSYPESLRTEEVILASGVAAAFSVKRSIEKPEIEEACRQARDLRRGVKIRKATLRHELVPPVFYGLLAESHTWKAPGSKPLKNVEKIVSDFDALDLSSPREGLDLICVADLACWRRITLPLLISFSEATDGSQRPDLRQASTVGSAIFNADQGSSVGLPSLSPLTRFIGSLWAKLALNDQSLEAIASGFRATEPSPHGKFSMKNWRLDEVVSDDVIGTLESGPVSGRDWEQGYM